MKIAILMNSLSSIHMEIDTSLAFFRAIHQRGWPCIYFKVSDLFCKDGQAFAHMYQLNGVEHPHVLPSLTPMGVKPLTDFDLILMRQDPPVNQAYLYATYALDLAARDGVIVANRPQGVRDLNEKMALFYVPQCCAPTLVSSNIEELRAFWDIHQEVIYKPLNGLGGRSVFYVGNDSSNLSVILETLTHNGSESIMAQHYISDIKSSGDKRILLIDGEPIPYALARIPKEGELRGNIVAGGRGVVVPLSARDNFICKEVSPLLKAKGLSFVGIDVIGDYLTEINVTSPSCLCEIQQATGIPIADQYLTFLENNT